MLDINKLIRCYRELKLTKVEAMFILEIAVHDGKYYESEANWSYSPSTIKKIRKSLQDKLILDWVSYPKMLDTLYVYDLTMLDSRLQYIDEQKRDETTRLIRALKREQLIK